jgi:hypothetical protein
MTKEPEYNAHATCAWCGTLRPVSQTTNFNGVAVCRDGDCLPSIRRACDVAPYISDDLPTRHGDSE